MAHKHRNTKKTEATNRVRALDDKLSNIELSSETDLRSVGVVLDHPGSSHISIFTLKSIRGFMKEYIGVDVCLFMQQLVPPITSIDCATFPIKDLFGWNNPVISTSISTTLDCLNSDCTEIYHYAFDLEFLGDNNVTSKDIDRCFTAKEVTVITRSDIYKKIIEQEFDIEIDNTILIDFDVAKIMKIIFGGKRNNDSTIENEQKGIIESVNREGVSRRTLETT